MVEQIVVDNDLIKIKFAQTPKVSTITNDKFTLVRGTSTPIPVAGPFKEIVLRDHYKSIPRILYLHFAAPLLPDVVYVLTISGMKDAAGRALPDYRHSFIVGT